MVFSAIPFLYYFLPAVVVLYLIAPKCLKNTVLLLSSLLFYAWGEPRLVTLMVVTIVLFYSCGLCIERAKAVLWKKIWLGVSVASGLALLGFFKYADFFLDTFNSLTGLSVPLLRIALPVGISFYTFQCVSYAIDVYRGTVPAQKNPISFGAYVAMFPQLIAGPIVRYSDIAVQLRHRTHSWEKISTGLRRFIVGLGKKVILADGFAGLIAIFRASGEQSVVFYWLYAISFALNIYFDFSGYSDMAIGLGKLFGFEFMENFNYPYISKSVTEFWRRWHISLGSWFRDYVYIPMGGNRVSRGRWVFNILTVWMLTGLWHGAAWNFVAWGLVFALLLLIEKRLPMEKLPSVLRHSYVLLTVTLSFVLFNAESFAQAGRDIGAIFGFGKLPFLSGQTLYYLRSYALLLVVGIVGATPLVKSVCTRLERYKVTAIVEPLVLALILLVCTGYLVDGSFSPFLYFRF